MTKPKPSWAARVFAKVFPWTVFAEVPDVIWGVFLGAPKIGLIAWAMLGIVIPGIIAVLITR